jgi:hypothetical protein
MTDRSVIETQYGRFLELEATDAAPLSRWVLNRGVRLVQAGYE